MNEQQALATVDHVDQETGLSLRDTVYHAMAAGYLPGIKDIEHAMVLVQKGRDLGLTAMQTLEGIYIVEGRPYPSAKLKAALIERAYGEDVFYPESWDSTHCTIRFKKPNWPTYGTLTYTIEDAKKALLTDKKAWKANPMAMLFYRCISTIANAAFPKALLGLRPFEGDDLEPDDVPDHPVFDAKYWCSRWFTTVEGTPFDSDEGRAAFMRSFTAGEYSSLKEYLAENVEDAGRLIREVETRISVGDFSCLDEKPEPAEDLLTDAEFLELLGNDEPDGGHIRRNGASPDPKPMPEPPDEELPREALTAWVESVRNRCAKAVSTKRGQGIALTGDVRFVRERLLALVGGSNTIAKQLLADLTRPDLVATNDLRLGEAEVLRVIIATEGDELRRYADRLVPQGALL